MTGNKGKQKNYQSSFAWFLVLATVASIVLSQLGGIA